DLPVVNLGLREVGVDREVRSQQWSDVVEEIETFAAAVDRGAWTVRPEKRAEHVRLEVEAMALSDLGDADDAPRRRQVEQSLVASPPAPVVLFGLAPNGALKIRAPLRRIGVEIHRPEWNLDFDRPPLVEAAYARQPDPVPRSIL